MTDTYTRKQIEAKADDLQHFAVSFNGCEEAAAMLRQLLAEVALLTIMRQDSVDEWAEADTALEAAGIVMNPDGDRKTLTDGIVELAKQRDELIAAQAVAVVANQMWIRDPVEMKLLNEPLNDWIDAVKAAREKEMSKPPSAPRPSPL